MEMESSLAFSLVMLLSLFLRHPQAISSTAANDLGFRLQLTRANAANGLNRMQLLNLAAERSKKHALNPTVYPSEGEYLVDLAIGTPAHPFAAILDTRSDLIWTQCKICRHCIAQPDPLFDALNSSTLSTIPCSSQLCQALPEFECAPNCFYTNQYGDGTITLGFLGKESFTLGTTRIPNITFGCGLFSAGTLSNSSGILGIGRGPLSLVSQLGVEKFSYCFTSFDNVTSKSSLLFGSLAKLQGRNTHTTPLILNPVNDTLYYLSLKGISVGGTRLPIPQESFELKKDGTGGTIIDSGTTLLVFNAVAFEQVEKAFKAQIKLPAINGTDMEGFDICFKTQTGMEPVPKLIFHFVGADWDLPKNNYMYYDNKTGLHCLLVMKSPDNISTIIGNVATQNMHVLYDLKNDKLSFVPANCNQL